MRYVGITCRDVAVRSLEHLTSGDLNKAGLDYRLLHQVPDLLTAKGSEQSYIDTNGLVKNGGQLVNQINSMATNNPNLSQAKDQATAVGAVPVAAGGGILTTVADVGAAIVKLPIFYIDLNAVVAYNQSTEQL